MNWEKYRPAEFEYRGKWVNNWFSNMVPDEITIDDITYPSVENYYQAMKSEDRAVHKHFATLSPSNAKWEGRKLPLRENWEKLKRIYMFNALLVKFEKPEWMEKLLNTGNEKIIEWNNWNDKIWGVSIVDNEGENILGILLMNIREGLKYKKIDDEKSNENNSVNTIDSTSDSSNS